MTGRPPRAREETPDLDATTDDTASEPGSDATMPRPGGSRYRLREEIARGGMGVVYRATDEPLGREVAVKVLQEKFAPDSGAARRFADEARIAAQLQHPAIPPVHDVGTLLDGRPFLAMKLVRGSTLDRLLEARPDPANERGRFIAVFEQVCQALAYAHAHDVIHRDLKPSNVMVGAFGEVQVMDWGLAKVLAGHERDRAGGEPRPLRATAEAVSPRDSDGAFTEAGIVLGTPAFMPPEQAAGAVGEVDQRSDVFGLGAILAVILTGKPPFAAASAEARRVKAARGEVQECFARLDGCGADPELVALCKRCLAPERQERPADAGAVAWSVAQLRAAADDRARRAELERVRLEGEQAAAEARAAERRKRRRLSIAAAAVLALAVVGGLTGVLAVQRRANAELADERAEVEARFQTALRAIATFHTGVSEDVLLKNDQFKELRTKLLKEAVGFYTDLEQLLEGRTDARSRKLLAEGYFRLGELTDTIGDKRQALQVHRQALALRRELASAPGADADARLDVARSLRAVGSLLDDTGDKAAALVAFQEQQGLAAALAGESPSDAAQVLLAQGQHSSGAVLWQTGKPAEALAALGRAVTIQHKLADANPAVTQFQAELARSHNSIGEVLAQTGKPAEAITALEQALAIRRKLADANPAVTQFQAELALTHHYTGFLLDQTGKRAEALKAYEQALAIRQKLADANPAVTQFQADLAWSHNNIGVVLDQMGKPTEALKAHEQALAIRRKLADANPAVAQFQADLAWSHHNIGFVLEMTGKRAEALTALQQALAIRRKLADANPAVAQFQSDLAWSHSNIGNSLARQGRWTEAIPAYQEALTVRMRLAEANPTVTSYQRDLASSLSRLGKVQRRDGRPAAAVTSFRKAIAIMEGLPTLTPVQLYDLSCYRALFAGVAGEPGSGVRSAESEEAAHGAMSALRRAVAAGYRNAAHMKKDADLDALRPRPDFQQLMKELEAKSP